MKVGRVSLIRISLFCLFVFTAFSNVHADPYDVQALMAHLKEKLGNIQTEYEVLRQKQQLSYLWDKNLGSNLILLFRKEIVSSKRGLKEMVATLLSFESSDVKEQLEKFLRVFTSEAFLRALFGDNIVNKLITSGVEDAAYVFWDKEEYNNPSGKLLFLLRVEHTLYEEAPLASDILVGGDSRTTLDMQLVFAYDTKSDNIQFIGTKDKIFIDGKEEKMDFPIYSPSHTNASVAKNKSMNMD